MKNLLICLQLFSAVVISAQVLSETTQEIGRPPVLKNQVENPSPQQTPKLQKNEQELQEKEEIIRVETSLVTVPVSVIDRYGRFISDLRKEDFQIFENDVPQEIQYFNAVETPFSVILMLDVSPSTRYKIGEIRDAAIAFTYHLRPDDRVMVIAFDRKIQELSRFTNNRQELRQAIMRVDFGEGTSLYDAVDYALKKLSEVEGKKAVVLLTDGVDTTSKRASYNSTLYRAEEADALIYVVRYDTYSDMKIRNYPPPGSGRTRKIGIIEAILGTILNGGNVSVMGPAGSSLEEYTRGKRYLQELANVSSGSYFEATENLDDAFAKAADELRRQYTLGYYPENPGKTGERRHIKVRVFRPNVIVKAKNSYIVGQSSASYNQVQQFPIQRNNQPGRPSLNNRNQTEGTIRRPPF